MRRILVAAVLSLAVHPAAPCLGSDPFIAELIRFNVNAGPGSQLFLDALDLRVRDFNGEISNPLRGSLPVQPTTAGPQPTITLRIPSGTPLPDEGTSSMIPIQIERVDIPTVSPAAVSFGGAGRIDTWQNRFSHWDQGSVRAPAGNLTLTRTSDTGGTFDLDLNVSPNLELFGTNSARQDVSQTFTLPSDTLSLVGGPQQWSRISPAPNSRGNLFLGVGRDGNATPFTLRGNLASIEIAAAPFAIPEPAGIALLLLCIGAGAATFLRRRPRSRATE